MLTRESPPSSPLAPIAATASTDFSRTRVAIDSTFSTISPYLLFPLCGLKTTHPFPINILDLSSISKSRIEKFQKKKKITSISNEIKILFAITKHFTIVHENMRWLEGGNLAKKPGENFGMLGIGWRGGVARRWIVQLIKFSRLAKRDEGTKGGIYRKQIEFRSYEWAVLPATRLYPSRANLT